MKVAYSDAHAGHDPRFFLVRGRPAARSAEQPERATRLLDACRRAGHAIVAPPESGPAPRAAVHAPAYLDFLATAWARWRELPDAGDEVVANVHPMFETTTYPRSIVGRAGLHMADAACPIGERTWEAACAAVDCAAHAARLALGGERVAYALCRPPGHHATADKAGGFCFLNNAAIAAQILREAHPRVAIVDVDVHHGNGTQSIFWRRRDVFTVSLHADPRDFYPFFVGHAHERGEGAGRGFNLNLPLAHGSGDAAYLAALDGALAEIRAFAPGALVVALGLDAHEADPLGGLAITTAGFGAIAARLAALGLPTVLVQEGGYLAPALGDNLASFLGGFG